MDFQPCLGIEYGDLRLRVACADEGPPDELPIKVSTDLAVLYDPEANDSRLGVGFPSIYRRIGDERMFELFDRRHTATTFIAERIGEVSDQLIQAIGARAKNVAVAVPSALGEHRRAMLTEVLGNAGLSNASFVDTCTAAAFGFHAGARASMTILVVSVSYSDCEYSLIRVAQRHSRVLAAGFVPGVSSQALDARFLETMIRALQDKSIFLGLERESRRWLDLRWLAAKARKDVTVNPFEDIQLDRRIAGLDREVVVRFNRIGYLAELRPKVASIQDAVSGMLETDDISRDQIDSVLLVGDEGRSVPLAPMIAEALDRPTFVALSGLVSIGAAWHMLRQTDAIDESWTREIEPQVRRLQPMVWPTDSMDSESTPIVEVLDIEPRANLERAPTAMPDEPIEKPSIEDAMSLAEAGRTTEAVNVLNGLIHRAVELRDKYSRLPVSRAGRYVEEAWAKLHLGQPDSAIRLSHKALEAAPDDPHVFSSMIEVHIKAAEAMSKPEQFPRAIKYLNCAHSHDATNKQVQMALAERYFAHAKIMVANANHSAALRLINDAMRYNPKLQSALDLRKSILMQMKQA